MYLTLTVPKMVACESYYSGSVVAREPFRVEIRAYKSDGSFDSSYNGGVQLYANSPTSDTEYPIAYAGLVSGYALSQPITLTSVFGTGSGRKITAMAALGDGSVEVGVWFRGNATVFDGSTGSYCQGIGYGSPPSNYVALPGYGLCGEDVVVYNPSTSRTAAGKVWDVGPFFDANSCGGDAYWNTGTVPKAEVYKGQRVCDVCNSDCDDYYETINGAIIDISPAMMSALGGSGTITGAYWRFN